MKRGCVTMARDGERYHHHHHHHHRYSMIDHIRGLAVVMMIIFHFCYDMVLFDQFKIDLKGNLFWRLFPIVDVCLFLFSVGLSLPLAHPEKIRWPAFWRRLCKIGLAAVLVSAVTYAQYPKRWVYFGTLHCITVTSLMALPFLRRPKLAVAVALALLIPSIVWDVNLPWIKLSHRSMDYISPFPWFGLVLLGIGAFYGHIHKISWPLSVNQSPPLRLLAFLGRHALIIYLIHQPLLYASLYILYGP